MDGARNGDIPAWTLLSSHGLVLLYISSNPDATIREVAADLHLTERRVADLIRDLANEDLIDVFHHGRRNHYKLSPKACFRHPFTSDVSFESFVSLWKRSRARAGRGLRLSGPSGATMSVSRSNRARPTGTRSVFGGTPAASSS